MLPSFNFGVVSCDTAGVAAIPLSLSTAVFNSSSDGKNDPVRYLSLIAWAATAGSPSTGTAPAADIADPV